MHGGELYIPKNGFLTACQWGKSQKWLTEYWVRKALEAALSEKEKLSYCKTNWGALDREYKLKQEQDEEVLRS